ncbi:MAG: hypothetical protein ABFD49_07045 [Armatimonadota bacterium]|nr:hypothetical protein [bacterium]
MELLREVVESFVRLVKSDVHSGATLVATDNVFEVTNVPSVVLQGPTLSEDSARRTSAMLVNRNESDMTFEECRHPRLYHLDFDVIVTCGNEPDLLDITGKLLRFYQLHTALAVGSYGSLNLTELTPLGGLKRVNLSNLRQASGRCRIEDCPVYDGRIQSGKLVADANIELGMMEETN